MSKQKIIKEISEIRIGVSFLILTPRTVNIPGDERSQTSPGHGYGPETIHSWTIQRFDARGEWESEIKRLVSHKSPFVPVEASRPEVTVETTVSVSID